ncbi:hypothetical protein [Paenibacillus alginolyticus]|nr:hypothetical protein [Paenibacillus frigoriresistens]
MNVNQTYHTDPFSVQDSLITSALFFKAVEESKFYQTDVQIYTQ